MARIYMYKLILFVFVILIPINSFAGNVALKKNGYTYDVMANDSLRIYNKKHEAIYNGIKLKENGATEQKFSLHSVDDLPAIVHFGDAESLGVTTYYTLKTSLQGTTLIDCIYRKGEFAPKVYRIFLPYSICSLNKKLSKENLHYKLPQISANYIYRLGYPCRIKVKEQHEISLYYYWSSYGGPEPIVQYKKKQLKLNKNTYYILGKFINGKEGLLTFNMETRFRDSTEFIETEQLKQKILREGVAFDIDNSNIKTEQHPKIEFKSIVE